MTLARNLTLALVGVVSLAATGCVGPMACGPAGCDINGPLARNSCGGCDGCGELYVDPWVNDPADACDPCDQCGNYNGQSCGKCRSIFSGFACLWGYRYDAACGPDACDSAAGACDGCPNGCGSCASGPGEPTGRANIPSPGEPLPPAVPTPAEEGSLEIRGDVEIVPSGEPDYQPRRTRQIFRNRGGSDTEMPEASDY